MRMVRVREKVFRNSSGFRFNVSFESEEWSSFHSSREIWTQRIDLAPNVWLHSSVGRATHRQRGGHGFESRWSPDFFQASFFNGLNWKIYCDDHSSLWSITAVQKWIISYISHHFTPHGRYELKELTSLPMSGFIAQLVEQRTGNAEVTGFWIPLKPWFFFQASSFQLLKLENVLRWSFFTFIYNRSSKMN